MSISLIIDIAVILIILVSAGVSFFRGFVREVLTIFGVLGGAFAAYTFGSQLSPVFRGWFGIEDGVEGKEVEKLFDLIPYTYVADICAYAGIFLAVFLVLQLVSYFMAASVRAVGLGPVDRALGVVFGIARALLFLGIIYAVVGQIIPDKNKEEVLGNSKTIVYIEGVANWVKSFMPSDGGEAVRKDVLDKANTQVETITREKFKEIDILGDKKIKPEQNESGYKDQDRSKLNNLIDNESATETDPKLPERSTPND